MSTGHLYPGRNSKLGTARTIAVPHFENASLGELNQACSAMDYYKALDRFRKENPNFVGKPDLLALVRNGETIALPEYERGLE
ncbi:hypothetical protein TELCIR_04561 [Teladorsagia circumcincta]|uniref:Uncharacterized protein n=1 Tax=Teladorsagia circumcincta TaxID=45464 RepID=A0A2G9UTB2_TELCI|nr:hypothetical protein TELCIR_04561 [Teladorsagia circumcincta]